MVDPSAGMWCVRVVHRALPIGVLVALLACKERTATIPRPPASQPSSGPATPSSSQPATQPANDVLSEAFTQGATLSATRLRRDVETLAADAWQGRGPGTDGIHLAADWLQGQLQGLGLRGTFDGRFRQPFQMTVSATVSGHQSLAQPDAPRFRRGTDFEPFVFSKTAAARGRLLFVGFGIRSSDRDFDEYQGHDARGAIVVALSGEPGKGTTNDGAIRTKVLRARQAGAIAILIVRSSLDGPRADAHDDAGIVAVQITPTAAARLLGFDPVAVGQRITSTERPASREPPRPAVEIDVQVQRARATVHNISATLDPPAGTSTQSVVLGAHYDHLGFGGANSLADSTQRQVHNGADDNASGTAVVLEAARYLANNRAHLRRRVVFVLFAGEEHGLLGSAHFVRSAAVDPSSIAAMINLDMVGHLRDGRLHIMGTGSAPELPALAARAIEAHGLTGVFDKDAYGPSDHTSFYTARVPVLFLFTGAHEHYHRPSDDADTLDYPAMAVVGAVATDLVATLARAKARPTYVELPAPKPSTGRASAGRGYGPYFGSIPDFGERIDGVLLSGVKKGSPADLAGVKKGDVIVRFAGVQVKTLMDFTVALRGAAPGDVVEVEVRRAGRIVPVKAKLSKRD